jgi:tRNA pseudouridine13 synthase
VKLKCRPEDFRVEEVTGLRLKPRGAFSVYRLEKRYWNTLDAIRHLERVHGLRRLSRAGLKDRYSESGQYLSMPGRGPRLVRETNYTLRFRGMSDVPVSRHVLLGNRFRITLRALDPGETRAVAASLPEVRRFGLPNYYDEQRLGSSRHGQGFIARKLIDGHYNGALKLHLATPSPADDTRTRRGKEAMLAAWGDWPHCLTYAPLDARPVLQYLSRHPKDFEGAVTRLPLDLLEMFVNAYQSWLWNETLVRVLSGAGLSLERIRYTHGEFAFYRALSPADDRYLTRLVIPAPGPRAVYSSDRVAAASGAVLGAEGLTLTGLKLRFRIKGLFFKPYGRPAIVRPRGLTVTRALADELYPGCLKLTLSFFLPPGSYATLVTKRLLLPTA